MKDGFELCPPDLSGGFFVEKCFCHQPVGTYLCPPQKRPVRLRARTPPFHGGDTSSNLVRATKPCSYAARLFYFGPCEHVRIRRKIKKPANTQCLQKLWANQCERDDLKNNLVRAKKTLQYKWNLCN